MLQQDVLYRIFALFICVLVIYVIVMQLYVRTFRPSRSTKPLRYKYFRLYSNDLIKNSPSRTEKKYYNTANVMTAVFNGIMVTLFAYFLYKMFGIPFID